MTGGCVDIATLEKLELGMLEKICQLFFDQIGFTVKPAVPPTTVGISGIFVLYSKTSNASFALCQCAVGQALINLDLLGKFKDFLTQLNLSSGYFITTGSPEVSIKEFATANRINLIDGLKLADLINNLPKSSRDLLSETINSALALKQLNETGRFQGLTESSGRSPQQANDTGRFPRPAELGAPPICAKCGERMKFQVTTGKYKSGKYWQCPNPACGHIVALG
jgi:hypothetical protein